MLTPERLTLRPLTAADVARLFDTPDDLGLTASSMTQRDLLHLISDTAAWPIPCALVRGGEMAGAMAVVPGLGNTPHLTVSARTMTSPMASLTLAAHTVLTAFFAAGGKRIGAAPGAKTAASHTFLSGLGFRAAADAGPAKVSVEQPRAAYSLTAPQYGTARLSTTTPTAATSRLVLRPIDQSDALWIARQIADPAVLRWLTSPPAPYTLEHAQDFLDRFAHQPNLCAIMLHDLPVGVVSIENARSFDPTRADAPELGYWLARRAWGQGVMTEAARALTDWHFAGSSAPIHSGWIAGNRASEHVLTKLGFARTGKVIRRYANALGRHVPVVRVVLPPPGRQSRPQHA